MTAPTNRKTLALLGMGLIVLGALAIPVAAQEDDDGPREQAREHRQERREHAQGMRERHQELRERFEDHCAEPANETVAERCERARDVHNATLKARRGAHALLGAIDALEHRIARLEVKELRINTALAGGNLTANETADLEAKLARIDAAQQEMAAKLADLYARLDGLRERWDAVREHVVVLCHATEDGESHTIRVARPAAEAHLGHGDTMGRCAGDGDGA